MTDTERMFDTGKIGVFLDSIQHSTENRRGTDTKIIVLGLRVDPFDAKLALVLDSRLRDSLFALSDVSPRGHIKRIDAALGILRQNLHIFATPETEAATMALLQVGIAGVSAKVHKDRNEFVLTFKASFGPASKQELEFVEGWRGNQKFITFERAEPSLDFDEPGDEDEAEPVATRPAPMWDDGEQPQENEHAREVGSRPTAKRHKSKASKASAAKGKPNGAEAHA